MRRLTLTDAEPAVTAEALREALAAELLAPSARTVAREMLDRIWPGPRTGVDRF